MRTSASGQRKLKSITFLVTSYLNGYVLMFIVQGLQPAFDRQDELTLVSENLRPLLRFFTSTRTPKFKTNLRLCSSLQLIIQRPFRKQIKVYFNDFKRSWFLICYWWISIRFVLCFKVRWLWSYLCHNDGRENSNCKLAYKVCDSLVTEKRSN